MLESESSGVADVTSRFRTNSWSFCPTPLRRQWSRSGPHVHKSASCCLAGLISQRRGLEPVNCSSSCSGARFRRGLRNPSGQWEDHAWIGTWSVAPGCLWHVRHALRGRFPFDGHQVVDDGSESGRDLDGPCDSRGCSLFHFLSIFMFFRVCSNFRVLDVSHFHLFGNCR